ncbi:hypothetical protein BD289DRAFT_286319 [Coniella lustricola]|uniref:Uncharacterized protein n=1 Tax=Coniella lustricola TaxID=2025994 RepID=A0A2T3A5R6_9PEZI|nr:hypothetical protein BD289DRAFT_286319 [Coniella lustricola]
MRAKTRRNGKSMSTDPQVSITCGSRINQKTRVYMKVVRHILAFFSKNMKSILDSSHSYTGLLRGERQDQHCYSRKLGTLQHVSHTRIHTFTKGKRKVEISLKLQFRISCIVPLLAFKSNSRFERQILGDCPHYQCCLGAPRSSKKKKKKRKKRRGKKAERKKKERKKHTQHTQHLDVQQASQYSSQQSLASTAIVRNLRLQL